MCIGQAFRIPIPITRAFAAPQCSRVEWPVQQDRSEENDEELFFKQKEYPVAMIVYRRTKLGFHVGLATGVPHEVRDEAAAHRQDATATV